MSKFKVGDEVAIAAVVKITGIQNCATGAVTYQTDRGFCIHEVLMDEIALSAKPTDRLMGREKDLSPAPEPKYYTGKVFAVRTKESDATPEMRNRVGHTFAIKDGVVVGNNTEFDLDGLLRITSFSEFRIICSATEWAEVKD